MAISVELGDLEPTVEQERRLAALDAALALALEDEAAGRVKPAEEVFDRLSAKYKAMARAQGE